MKQSENRYILTTRSTQHTAKILGRELGLEVSRNPQRGHPAIRWANASQVYPVDTQYNSRESIIRSNKIALADNLHGKGIPCIEFYRGLPDDYPVVVRTTISSGGGNGIVIARNETEFGDFPNNYWSYWYNFSFELGVHILGGKIVRVFKKMWNKDDEPEPEFPIKNTGRGYRYSLRTLEKYKKLPSAVKKIYDETGVEMARLDIGWDADSKVYRLIEVNTAPSLSENKNTLKMYVDFLRPRLER